MRSKLVTFTSEQFNMVAEQSGSLSVPNCVDGMHANRLYIALMAHIVNIEYFTHSIIILLVDSSKNWMLSLANVLLKMVLRGGWRRSKIDRTANILGAVGKGREF